MHGTFYSFIYVIYYKFTFYKAIMQLCTYKSQAVSALFDISWLQVCRTNPMTLGK